jgi:hypothetical protein
LRLGQIETTPIIRNAPLKTPKMPSPGKQLKLDFTDLPEAVTPKNIKVARPVTELLELADDAPLESLPPSVRGEVLNNMESQVRTRLNENQLRMSVEPDIGRRPILTENKVLVTPYEPTGLGASIPLQELPIEPLMHGTRVDNLVLQTADPAQGSALSELGAGIYLSSDRGIAELASKAVNTEGLPNVAGRQFMEEGSGAIHNVFVSPTARIMDANTSSLQLEILFERVAKQFPGLSDRKSSLASPRTYAQLIDAMAEIEDSAAARLQFQQELTKALRSEGIDGVRGGDNIAIFNPGVLETTGVEKVSHLGQYADEAYDARAGLEEWGAAQNPSVLAASNALDADTIALNQKLNRLIEEKRIASRETWKDIQYEGLMDHPSRIPTLDEYSRLVVDDLYSYNIGDAFVPDPVASKEIADNIMAAIKKRGITVQVDNLSLNTGANFNPANNRITLNALTGSDDFTQVSSLNALLHEMFHSDINKLVAYVDDGVTKNESVVESAANAVLSILDPSLANNRKNRFDGFFDYLNDAESMYAKEFGGKEVTLDQVKKQYGELVVRMVKETVEEIAPKGFKTPAINELRIFGPEAFESFATNRYGASTSLSEAFSRSITSIDEGLTIASKLDKLATNPATGKLNTRVRDFLVDSFEGDELLKAVEISPADALIRKWAESLVRAAGPDPMRPKKAAAVLTAMDSNFGTSDDYIKVLTRLDKNGAKQYVPAINKGMQDVKVRKYC